MNYQSFRLGIVGMTLAMALTLGASRAQAQTSSANLLREAYVTLSRADHDYKGHRAEAMKQVEAAAKQLGENLRGDGKGHEKQGVSDDQLRRAKGLLEQSRGGLNGKARKHVDKAIEQISVALKIR